MSEYRLKQDLKHLGQAHVQQVIELTELRDTLEASRESRSLQASNFTNFIKAVIEFLDIDPDGTLNSTDVVKINRAGLLRVMEDKLPWSINDRSKIKNDIERMAANLPRKGDD